MGVDFLLVGRRGAHCTTWHASAFASRFRILCSYRNFHTVAPRRNAQNDANRQNGYAATESKPGGSITIHVGSIHLGLPRSNLSGQGIPYSDLRVGVPLEIYPNERRVALTPQNAALLLKKGFAQVLVEKSAGLEAQFLDEHYRAAGAVVVDRNELFERSDILLKVRPPVVGQEAELFKENSTLISFIYAAQNKAIIDALAAKKATVFAMEQIPRISRAQVFDALSSMANIAGYKAVLEAANHFGRFLTGQVTAAGLMRVLERSPHAKY
ncbi:hypothetical protein BN946_scf184799.g24 [Trametes cinnabarina]|uniref:proton-translocating NAD(P)(+) transhydrogenase n=1 Tax=Pycnoporus cinnabarinus TaxID=5643 RepID=A0A060S1U2_PYCCI|nr:hypothetical protein BN946_scf184799.g24 [Trametes cinnabarina]